MGEVEAVDHIETESCRGYLVCILSEKELIEKSKELAKHNEDLAGAEDRKKDLMADITAQIKKHEANIGVLARIVSQGKEYRNVPCEWRKNFTTGRKTLIRLDTYDVIKDMEIDDNERQSPLV